MAILPFVMPLSILFGFAFLAYLLYRLFQLLGQRHEVDNHYRQLFQEKIERCHTRLDQQSGEFQHITLKLQFANDKLAQEFKTLILQENSQAREDFQHRQLGQLSLIQQNLQEMGQGLQNQVLSQLGFQEKNQQERLQLLTQNIQSQLNTLSQQVENRLTQGFEKTSDTFTRIVERLTLIDAAQQKITELSTHVVSLQEIFADKRARGAFGEVQLSGILHNILPENSFSLQHTLSNGKRADCLLFLPPPTGHIVIDAKFPLENYRILADASKTPEERKLAEQRFRLDIKKHIQDIASKYILSGETADGAMLFIPAEAIFAELHSQYPDLIELSQKMRVWLTSPTTLMAILTTARAVLKDAATRQQIHVIQDHLRALSADFGRFEKRMEALSRHMDQAHADVGEIKTSAQKITQRFYKIDKVDLVEQASLEEMS